VRCKNCNYENENDYQYCIKCGTPLGQSLFQPLQNSILDSPEAKFVLEHMDKKQDWLVKKLEKKFGMPQSVAENLIQQLQVEIEKYLKSPQYRQDLASQGKRKMIIGLLFAVGGGVLTIVGLTAAMEQGGTFVIWWGAVIFGLWDFISGMIQWLKNRELTQTTSAGSDQDFSFMPGFTPQSISSIAPKSGIAVNEIPPTVVNTSPQSKLILPDKSEINLTSQEITIGRNEIEKAISPAQLTYISRQHFKIKFDSGNYYIMDSNSSNGTMVNGIDIRGIGWQELKSEDRIDMADMISIKFRADR
jgi:hypothetical protein